MRLPMKMLLTASDQGIVEQARKRLFDAGIPCEIRQKPADPWHPGATSDPELWVTHDGDLFAALKVLGPRPVGQLAVVFSAS